MNWPTILTSLMSPAGLTAMTSGAVAVLTFLVGQLHNTRLQTLAEFRDIDERSKAIAFWQLWITAQTVACTDVELVEAKALARLQLNELAKAPAMAPKPAPSSPWRSWLLLDEPANPWLWLARAPYFLMLGGLLVYLVPAVGVLVSGKERSGDLPVLAATVGIWLVLIVCLRLGSRITEARFIPRPAGRRGFPGDAVTDGSPT